MKTSTVRFVSGLAAVCLIVLVSILAIPRSQPGSPPQGRRPAPLTPAASKPGSSFNATHFPTAASCDATVSAQPAGFALSLPGVTGELVFEGRGELTETTDRRAKLTGVLVSVDNPGLRYSLELKLSKRVDAGQTLPGKLEPVLLLNSDAYTGGGGSVDVASWRHYRVGKGVLRGVGTQEGAKILIKKTKKTLVQVGAGANNANLREGAFMTFRYQVAKQPKQGQKLTKGAHKGGVLALDLDGSSFLCAARALNEVPFQNANSSHAFTLPGLDTEFIWFAGGSLVEHSDGSAHLSGVIGRETSPSEGFQVDLWFGSLIQPGDDAHPPTGSPKLELSSAAYVENGGPVDASSWRYYEDVSGRLLGTGDYLGAEYSIARRGPALQLGYGANGKNTGYGVSCWFSADLESAPTGGAQLPARIDHGDLNMDLEEGCSECVSAPVLDPNYFNGQNAVSLWLPGIAGDLAFTGASRFVHHADGSASLHGVAVSASNPGLRFQLDLLLGGRLNPGEAGYPPAGSPKNDLDGSSYVENGGPVDRDLWVYFQTLSGTLRGLGLYAGAEYDLRLTGPATQYGIGAGGKSIEFGLSTWIEATLVSAPVSGAPLSVSSSGDIAVTLGGDCASCPDTADQDPDQPGRGDFSAMWIPDLGSEAFDLISGGRMLERHDGTATLTGVVADLANPENRWRMDFQLAERVDPGSSAHPPASSPKKDLSADSYIEQGGPIDTAGWHYYTSFAGRLFGEGENAGAEVKVDMVGPPFQVGLGASGRNLRRGASAWLDLEVLLQPTTGKLLKGGNFPADVNLDLDRECEVCADEAGSDSYATHSAGHAFWIPLIGKDFVWSSDGTLIEYDDGTARLSGFIVRQSDPSQRFFADVTLSDRINAGDAGHPPATSPKLELSAGAYVDNGGPIDPDTWHYYTSTEGTLTGLDSFAGAVLALSRRGPSFQIGHGASGKNTGMGGSGWLDVTTLSQPTAGPALPAGIYYGDINIDLGECP